MSKSLFRHRKNWSIIAEAHFVSTAQPGFRMRIDQQIPNSENYELPIVLNLIYAANIKGVPN